MKEYNQVKYLINNDEKYFVENFINIISKLSNFEIYNLLKDNKIKEIVMKNDLFFKHFNELCYIFPDIFYLLDELPDEYIKKNIKTILDFKIDKYYARIYNLCRKVGCLDKFLEKIKIEKKLLMDEEYIQIFMALISDNKTCLENNIDFFIDNCKSLILLKDELEKNNFSTNILNKINLKIDSNPDLVVYEMLNTCVNIDNIEEEKIIDYLKHLLNEVLKYEHKKYHDIKMLTPGAYSTVYQIGNKVLKIGSKRKTFKIRNDKRLLQPLLREEINSIINKAKVLFCIELEQAVDTKNINKEDVYLVYKDLRDRNIYWIDARENNVGRLIKDNKPYYWGISKVSKNALGFLNDNDEVLKKGDLVVIDSDYIYTEEEYDNNKESINIPNSYFVEFEKRYQQERRKSK